MADLQHRRQDVLDKLDDLLGVQGVRAQEKAQALRVVAEAAARMALGIERRLREMDA